MSVAHPIAARRGLTDQPWSPSSRHRPANNRKAGRRALHSWEVQGVDRFRARGRVFAPDDPGFRQSAQGVTNGPQRTAGHLDELRPRQTGEKPPRVWAVVKPLLA